MDDQKFAATMKRAREGDQEAMTALVEEYQPQILRVARGRLVPEMRSTFDSMDLVQSVHRSMLMSLRKNKFTFNGSEDLVALAVTMIKREVARKAARLNRGQEILESLDDEFKLAILAVAEPGVSADTIRKHIVALFEVLNEYCLAKYGRRLTQDRFRRLLFEHTGVRV
jgi:DNA-directed RNA polymerase specialized sigma24 family protein